VQRTLEEILDLLRRGGSDTTDIEVKAAVGGFPESLTASLSALANLPGGGVVVLGLDEHDGFRPVPINASALKQALGSKARTFQPPLTIEIEDGTVDGLSIVVCRVRECNAAHKPCRASDGRAYLRSWDGDHLVTTLDEQAFLLQRGHPDADRAEVPSTSVDDLDPVLVAQWNRNVVANDPRGLGRFDDGERLQRAGVVSRHGAITLAGLLTLGVHPQQFFPRLSLQLAVAGRGATRTDDLTVATGPLSSMLDAAMDWARRVLPAKQWEGEDGHLRNVPVIPLVAFRELVSNALVHRDFSDWATGTPAEVRLLHDRLLVVNPGGLHGISVDQLGYERTTTSRNARLVAIAQHVTSPDTGGRVIEALSTGLAVVRDELHRAALPAPVFVDNAIRFTAIVKRSELAPSPRRAGRNRVEQDVYAALVAGPQTARSLAAIVGTGEPNVRKALRSLVKQSLVVTHGGKGRPTTYERATPPD